VWDLKQAVEIMGNAQLGTDLSDQEAALIAAFLEGLTGEQPRVEYPILPVETAKTPKPSL
jgi:cytochrome c peroxidase